MASNKITFSDKVGIVPKSIHIQEWWDDDVNEIKAKHNLNDDRITVNDDKISFDATSKARLLNTSGTNTGDQTLPITIVNTNSLFSTALGAGVSSVATNSNFFGQIAGVGATNASSSNFLGFAAGQNATNASNSNFFGVAAGENATSATGSNFFGATAGKNATLASYSNFLGRQAGMGATEASYSNFLGIGAGVDAIYAGSCNFLGSYAGEFASGAPNSNFLGTKAGGSATNAGNSNFFGWYAGNSATSAFHSNFFGWSAGDSATNAGNSNFFGRSVGKTFTGNNVGINNIIIGTNISLPNLAANSINLGGVLFGTGTYATTSGDPSIVPSATGKIGVGIVIPTEMLHVADNILAGGTIIGSNLSGTNTGDQTTIVGITGTKAQFDTAVTDGNIMYIGDAPTAHTHTFASLTSKPTTIGGYGITDAMTTAHVANALIAQDITDIQNLSGTNTGDNAINTLYSGLVTNATHTGEVTGATTLTITANAVTTVKVLDANITNAKLANMATKTYKGRTSALTGVPEDVAVATLKTDLILVKADVGLGNVDNTSDLGKPVSTAQQSALDLKQNLSEKDAISGYAGLDGSGKINPLQLPALAITDTFVVATQVAMLALTAEVGDVAVRTDLNKSYILKVTGATVLANWQELLTPTDAVSSVFGRSGVVTAQNGDYTADQVTETATKVFVTPAEKTAITHTNRASLDLVSGTNTGDQTLSGLGGEPAFTKNTAFNKNFGTLVGEVMQGNDARWQPAGSYDNYVSWNLKTGGVQRIAVTSGGTLDIVGGTNVTAAYSAGGIVTLSSLNNTYSGTDFIQNQSASAQATSSAWLSGILKVNGAATFASSVTAASGVFTGAGDSSFVGNVGIGTSSPTQAKLDILQESDYTSHTGHGLSILSNATDAYTALYMGTDDTVDSAYIQSAGKNTSFTSKKLLLNPNGGNVGIGTTTPSKDLVVSNGGAEGIEFDAGALANVSEVLAYNRSTSAWNTIRNSALAHEFYISGVEKLKIDSSGNSTFAGNLEVQGADVTITANIIHAGDGDTYFGFNANDSWRVVTGGTQALILNSAQNATFAGNVGIGGAASDGNLHVRKTGLNTGITNVLMNANFADGSNGTGLSIGYRTDETTAVLAPRTATGNLAFYSYNGGWSESMRIKNNGNVGIGDTSPQGKLEVNNRNTATGAALFIKGGTDSLSPIAGQYTGLAFGYGGGDIYNNASILWEFTNTAANGKLHFAVNPTSGDGTANLSDSKMTIQDNGNVGIGTTIPSANLHVIGTTGNVFKVTNSIGTYALNGYTWTTPSSHTIQTGGYLTLNSGYAGSKITLTDGAGSLVVNNGNVGIGTTAPLANLDISNVAGTTYQQWSYDNPGANNYNLTLSETVTAGNVRFVFDQKNAGAQYSDVLVFNQGKIGVGTDEPISKLDVAGTGNFTGNVAINGTKIGTDQTFGGAYRTFAFGDNANGYNRVFATNDASDGIYINASTGNGVKFRVNGGGSNVMVIDSSGNVGIGTDSPGAKLDIKSSLTAIGTEQLLTIGHDINWNLKLQENWNASGIQFDILQKYGTGAAANVLTFFNGNVGIGTTSPSKKLDVQVAGGDGIRVSNSTNPGYYSDLLLNLNDISTMQLTCLGTSILQAGNTGNTVLASRTNKDIILSPNGTGNVGIGTTTPTLAKLQVAGTGYFSGAVTLAATTASTSSTTGALVAAGGVGIGKALFIGGDVSTARWITPDFSNHWIDGSPGHVEFNVLHNAGNVWTNAARTIQVSTGLSLGITTSNLLANANTTDPKGYLTLKGYPVARTGSMSNIWLVGGNATDAVSQINSRLQVGFDQWSPNLSNTDTLYVGGTGRFTSTVTATNFILSSDERKKTKIKDLSRDNINVSWKTFEMKNEEGEYRVGVIAQELEIKHPEFVNTDNEGFKSVKYIDLLISKIAELEARLEKAGI